LAASAPIFQVTANCESFSAVITDSFRKADPLCPHIISSSWNLINELSESPEGLENLTHIFKLCTPLKNAADLKSYLNEIYGDIAMANYPYESNFLNPLPSWPVKAMCSEITNHIDKYFDRNPFKLLTAIYHGINVYNNYTGNLLFDKKIHQINLINLSNFFLATGSLKCNDINPDIPNIQMDSWNYQVGII
jgi:lysosomal Pro-X carboxypeptidase